MKKFFKILITIFFFVLPIFLLGFVSMLANLMRWQTGSPLVPGYNWMRWSHVYLVFSSLFCLALYIPAVLSILKKRQKILIIPLIAAILFFIFSVVFVGVSRKAYYNQIIQQCDREIKSNPNDSIPLERKATAYDKLGEHEKAIELFNKAMVLTSKPAYIIHDRGLAYTNMKEYVKAIQDFTKAIEMGQNEKDFVAQCYNDRAVAYFHSGEYDKSWQDVNKSMDQGYRVHPGFLAALEARGYRK